MADMSRWPHDNPAELKAFYGDPGKGEVEPQLIWVKAPWQMYFEGKPIEHFRFHRRAAPCLLAALNEIWDFCHHDQTTIEHYGLHRFDGTYNHRLVRGSKTKWSNHAFGAAIDINAENNGFNTGRGTMPDFVVRAFERQGFRWGGRYQHRTDPMHFEACDNGRHPVEDLPRPAPDVDRNTDPEPPKPLTHSKISNTQIVAGGGAVIAGASALDQASDAISKVSDTADTFSHLVSLVGKAVQNPMLWLSILVVITAGLTIYWRWKDHGRGKVEVSND
jgi:hypothetical protein